MPTQPGPTTDPLRFTWLHKKATEAWLSGSLKAEPTSTRPKTDTGATPLLVAANRGHGGVVEQLLKAGAKVDKAKADGSTPLFLASHQGHEGVIEQLLRAEADPNTARDGGIPPLTIASLGGHSRVCSLLLEAGANVNHSTGNLGAALRAAVARGRREAALVLIKYGASSSGDTLTRPMLEDLTKWMTEARNENDKAMEEKDAYMRRMS